MLVDRKQSLRTHILSRPVLDRALDAIFFQNPQWEFVLTSEYVPANTHRVDAGAGFTAVHRVAVLQGFFCAVQSRLLFVCVRDAMFFLVSMGGTFALRAVCAMRMPQQRHSPQQTPPPRGARACARFTSQPWMRRRMASVSPQPVLFVARLTWLGPKPR